MNEIFEKFGEDPLKLCKDWYEDAEKEELNDPEAVCLSTCTKDGVPSNRMILIKGIGENGFKFHTNSTSQKGQDLANNQKAAICWYWKSLRKQIRIAGHVEMVSETEANEYFASRRRERQIGAWASDQSSEFESWEDLQNSIKAAEEKFKDEDTIPRPPHWNGYRLIPSSIEFWIAHRDRLHTRFKYIKHDEGHWTATWLYP